MNLDSFIAKMPKIELHVHLEGSIRPETLLKLARRHGIALPANTVKELHSWYTFTDFDHFIDVYQMIANCLRSVDDIELITREFLVGQAAQNIRYSEVTYTAYTQYQFAGLAFEDQLAAINRARDWARQELDTHMTLTIDIARDVCPDEGLIVADWAISGMGRGVSGFGLGGPEIGNPPEKFEAAFARARAAGLPGVPHAGETEGPASIWGALRSLQAVRIGHGVRCVEDPALVAELRDRKIPLEVCPTSNVCLKVVPNFEAHPLPQLIKSGLLVTINSDDPPLFNTNLTLEYQKAARTFNLDTDMLEQLVWNAFHVSFMPSDQRDVLEAQMRSQFSQLRAQFRL